LRAEWSDYRRRYSPLRTELLERQIALRDLRANQRSRLIGNQRLREAVSKLKPTNGDAA
jgi:hypothetical protein